MPEKFLGLDIGSESVKAVLLSRGLRGAGTVTAARRVGIAEAGGVAEALKQLFFDESLKGAIGISALPAAVFSFRNLQLPFREERKIRQTLFFAVEPLIHQPLDDVAIDYTTVGQTKETNLFAAIVDRNLIAERKSLLAPYVRETAVIDVGAVPLASFLSRQPDFPSSVLILDIGRNDSTAVFAGKGRIYHVRHFYFGGQTATGAIADALKIEPKDAEEIKIKGETPPEALEAIARLCEPFLAELKTTVNFLNDRGRIPGLPARIILTGGGARTPSISDSLAKLFLVAVETTDLLAAGGFGMDEAARSSWEPSIMDQALALAARPPGRGTGFNFVKREQELRGDKGERGGILKKAVAAAAVIVVLAGVEIGLDDYGMRLRIAQLKKDVISEYKKIDPETTRIVDPVAQLKGKIARAKKLSAGKGHTMAALDIFREISAVAPRDILLVSLSLDESDVVLKGEAPNFDAMDAFKKSLEGSRYIKTVTVGSTSLMKEEKGVEFNLKAALKR